MSAAEFFLKRMRIHGDLKIIDFLQSLEQKLSGTVEKIYYGRQVHGYRRAVLKGQGYSADLVHYLRPGLEEPFYVSFAGTSEFSLVTFGDGTHTRKWGEHCFIEPCDGGASYKFLDSPWWWNDFTYVSELPGDMQQFVTDMSRQGFLEVFPRRRVPLSQIPVIPLDPRDRGEAYALQMPAEGMPPCIEACGYLIDGKHRVFAARARGDTDIEVFDMTTVIDIADLPGEGWKLKSGNAV